MRLPRPFQAPRLDDEDADVRALASQVALPWIWIDFDLRLLFLLLMYFVFRCGLLVHHLV